MLFILLSKLFECMQLDQLNTRIYIVWKKKHQQQQQQQLILPFIAWQA